MPGSSNFQIWNPSSANQENDAGYTADSLRSGGAPVDALLPSPTFNKLAYQLSVGMYGLMTMMANKGFNVADTNPTTLASIMANILTTVDIRTGLLSVSYSPVLVFDCSRADGFECLLSGNTTVSVINPIVGQTVLLAFVQGGGGGYTVAYSGSNVKSPGTVKSTAGSTSCQLYKVLADNNLHPIGPMVVS